MTADPDKVLREFRNYRRNAAAAFVILTLGIIAAFAIRLDESKQRDAAIVRSGTVIAIDGCNRNYRTIRAARAAIARAALNTKRLEDGGVITPAQAEAARDQYTYALSELRLPDCVATSKILSSDPSRPNSDPVPLGG